MRKKDLEDTSLSYEEKLAMTVKREGATQNKFFAIYTSQAECYSEDNPKRLLNLSLSNQTYICEKMRNAVNYTPHIAVYRKNKKGIPELLWSTQSYQHSEIRESIRFLRKRNLEKIFPEYDICLGLLIQDGLKAIAWQLKSDSNILYIPWHNGCVIEDKTGSINFAGKTFEEVKRTYKILRFGKTNTGSYRVTLG